MQQFLGLHLLGLHPLVLHLLKQHLLGLHFQCTGLRLPSVVPPPDCWRIFGSFLVLHLSFGAASSLLNAALKGAAPFSATSPTRGACIPPPLPPSAGGEGNTPNLRIQGAFDPQSAPSRCIIPAFLAKTRRHCSFLAGGCQSQQTL